MAISTVNRVVKLNNSKNSWKRKRFRYIAVRVHESNVINECSWSYYLAFHQGCFLMSLTHNAGSKIMFVKKLETKMGTAVCNNNKVFMLFLTNETEGCFEISENGDVHFNTLILVLNFTPVN